MRTATVHKKHIAIRFPYDMQIIQAVRQLPGRDWDKTVKGAWTVPHSPWHCAKVIEVLKPFRFEIDPEISKCADTKAPKPKMKFPKNLYNYQKVGVEFMYKSLGRCIVADDMGLGKTAEALTFVNIFCGRTLVIAPANVIWKWAMREVPMWAKGKTVEVVTSGKQEIPSTDIVVMSYAIMVSRFDELNRTPFDCVIFDESHALRNYKSQRTRVAKALVKAGIPHVLFLSGTPFMNRPAELFPLLNMLDPIAYSNPVHFLLRYCGAEFLPGTGLIVPPNKLTNREELIQRLSRIMLRRTKREVMSELPDKTRTSIPVVVDNMGEYREAAREFKKWYRAAGKSTTASALAKLTALRQIIGRGKVKAAVELAESILQNDEQVVLFAHHKDVVSLLAADLKQYGVGIISGDTKPKDRQLLCANFLGSNESLMQNGKLRVMIITVAGAEGIDLFTASNIIFVEREWTPAREEQAEDRLHRNGQKNAVTCHYIVAQNTVDEKFDRIVREKRDVFGQVITQDQIVEILLEGIDND